MFRDISAGRGSTGGAAFLATGGGGVTVIAGFQGAQAA